VIRAALILAALALPAGVPAADLVIRGVRIVDGTGAPPREREDILVHDGRIARVAPGLTETPGARVIEAAGLTALPGFIDSHVHFVAAAGSAYRHDSDETIRELSHQHLRACLACGVTTVLDAGVFPELARDLRRWLADGKPGPRYLTTGPYIRPPDGYGHPRFGAESTPAEVEAKLDLIQSLGGVGVKLALEQGGPFGGPRQFTPELMNAIVSAARRRRLPLYVHAQTEATQQMAVRIGAHAIMHAPMDIASPKDLSEEFIASRPRDIYQLSTLSLVATFPNLYDVAMLDDPVVRLVVPRVELDTARAADAPDQFAIGLIGWVVPWTWQWTRPWIASIALSRSRLLNALRSGQQNLLRLHRAGVPIVAATDVPSPWPDGIYHFHGPQFATELALLGEAGLTPLEVIAAATRTPATMLGLAGEIGTLEVGKRADIVLVDGDPSVDIAALRQVRWTIKDGIARTPEEWMMVQP
jgi:imidazolonepropionase-like amidohydrolase